MDMVSSAVIGASVAEPLTDSLPAEGRPVATSNVSGPAAGHAASRTLTEASVSASVAPTVSSRSVMRVPRTVTSRTLTLSFASLALAGRGPPEAGGAAASGAGAAGGVTPTLDV